MTVSNFTKLHPPLVRAVADGLDQVLDHGRPLDQVIRSLGRKKQFGSRDRKFVAGQLYDVVRHLALLRAAQEALPLEGVPLQQQLLFLNLARKNTDVRDPSGVYPGAQQHIEAWQRLLVDLAMDRRLKASLPEWLWDKGHAEYGAEWADIADSLNSQPDIYLRANTLKTSPAELVRELQVQGVDVEIVNSDAALRLQGSHRLTGSEAYRRGSFEFQDLASQAAAILCDVRPGMTVVDACAGAGGKTLHLAALMRNKGRILVADADERRLEQLRFRCRRSGVKIAAYLPANMTDTFTEAADRVLLDVPCSASGTIPRKPEIKWHLSPKRLESLLEMQREIIHRYVPLVKPGGKLIYATCSLLRCESEDQAAWLADTYPAFSRDTSKRFLPSEDRTDGFFIAVFTRE